MIEGNRAKQPKEDDAKLPLLFSLLSLPIICFDAALLYLTENGVGSVDSWGHSPLVGFWSLFLYFSFAYNLYFILKLSVQREVVEKTPAFIILGYIFIYQAYLVLSYFTYAFWESIYFLNLILSAIGIVFLVLLLVRLFKYFKSAELN